MADQPSLTDEMIAGRRTDAARLPGDMPRWMARVITAIDRFSHAVGWLVAWFTVPIMGAMIYEVVARYAFTAPTVWAYDISRMFYGAAFVLGGGYALSRGIHIRSDFLYRNWSVKTQGRIDTMLYLTFFFPTMLLLLWVSGEWAWRAVSMGERSMDTAWAPLLGPVKSTLPVGILFLIIQGISELLKSSYAAWRGRWPDA
ncbi:MAG: TRAP transporter small permease subunit [Rhodospirillales bacterium]|nr:TRAP transporter small permease subunit [Rhodospirillales bacterium]